jgi:hypothetical protein
VGAITTYFIILIQFKQGNVKQELQSLTSIFRNYTHFYDMIGNNPLESKDYNETTTDIYH